MGEVGAAPTPQVFQTCAITVSAIPPNIFYLYRDKILKGSSLSRLTKSFSFYVKKSFHIFFYILYINFILWELKDSNL